MADIEHFHGGAGLNDVQRCARLVGLGAHTGTIFGRHSVLHAHLLFLRRRRSGSLRINQWLELKCLYVAWKSGVRVITAERL